MPETIKLSFGYNEKVKVVGGTIYRLVYVVDDLTARNAIPDKVRYEGMIVYVKDAVEGEGLTYQLRGGKTNTDRVVLIGGGSAIRGGIGGDISNQNDLINYLVNNYINLTQKGQASGVAPLNANQVIDPVYLPEIAISEYLGDFADVATALLDAGVQASQKGDRFTVQTDGGGSYIVIENNPTVTADVKELATPTAPVTANNAVTFTNKGISLATNTITGTIAQFNSALSDGSFATLAGTETFENKTLVSPKINLATNAQGDLYYRDNLGNFVRLPIGTEGQVLKTNGIVPSWGEPEAGGLGYVLGFERGRSSFSPSTNYYFGRLVEFSGNQANRISCPASGNLTAVVIDAWAATPGSANAIQFFLQVDGVDEATLGNQSRNTNDVSSVFVLGTPVAVTAGQKVSIRALMPAWSSQPTNVFVSGRIYIA